jgi:hypothetical protein
MHGKLCVGAPHGGCLKTQKVKIIVTRPRWGSPDVMRPGRAATRGWIEISLAASALLDQRCPSTRTSCSFGTQTRWRLGHPAWHESPITQSFETLSMLRPPLEMFITSQPAEYHTPLRGRIRHPGIRCRYRTVHLVRALTHEIRSYHPSSAFRSYPGVRLLQ